MTKGKSTYAVIVQGGDQDPLYSTDDTARLWAMVYGLFVGSGIPGSEAVMQTSGMVNSVVATGGKEQVGKLKDGRLFLVKAWQQGEVSK